eukprot:3507169-Rhodomonas_salina.2
MSWGSERRRPGMCSGQTSLGAISKACGGCMRVVRSEEGERRKEEGGRRKEEGGRRMEDGEARMEGGKMEDGGWRMEG